MTKGAISILICTLASFPRLGLAFTTSAPSLKQARAPAVIQWSTAVESATEEVSLSQENTATYVLNDMQDDRSPAEIENEKFDCDETVDFWRNFQINGLHSAQENSQNIASIVSNFVRTPEGTSYWLRHTGRTGYFAVNALLGNFGFSLHETLVKGDTSGSPFDQLITKPAVSSRILLEAALAYEQDYQRIEKGEYKKPYDMYENTRQSSPLYAGQQTARFVREAIGTLGRRKAGTEEAKRIWISEDTSPSLYPTYYRTAFHFQTDGWMSQDSADVYETSTETASRTLCNHFAHLLLFVVAGLFLGRQDAMQRTALPPLVSYSKEMRSTDNPLKVLEIACGTGRFLTFIRDNLPMDTEVTGVDLSPFYLNAARTNDSNWRRARSKKERTNNSNNVKLKAARLVQAKAEELPFEDGEFDAIVCVYLFHELPREIRAEVTAEMARVVKPGGRVIFTDSAQVGDRPIFDDAMKNFEKMNEPYYTDYIQDQLPLHFEKAGLKCLTKTVSTSTKTLAFEKPRVHYE